MFHDSVDTTEARRVSVAINLNDPMINVMLKGFERTGRGVVSVEKPKRGCLKIPGPLAPQMLAVNSIGEHGVGTSEGNCRGLPISLHKLPNVG